LCHGQWLANPEGNGTRNRPAGGITAIKLGKSQARFPFKQGKSRLGSWMEKISTTEDTENRHVVIQVFSLGKLLFG
jgi:hypothetical protein